jgi:hypothetical protein
MKDLMHLFSDPSGDEPPATEIDIGATSIEELQQEYKEQITALLQDGGVNVDCVQTEVRYVGRARDGKYVFLGMLRLVQWERKSALRLMIGMPLVERLLRRLLRGNWLAEVSHFGGMWLHPSSQMVDADVMRELRDVLSLVESSETPAHPARESMWSLPPELDSTSAPLAPPTSGH